MVLMCLFIVLFAAQVTAQNPQAPNSPEKKRADGYRGIWFSLGQFSEFGDKYSGGLGTYTANHNPIAIYAPEVDKTYFVYGGTTQEDEKLLVFLVCLFVVLCCVVCSSFCFVLWVCVLFFITKVGVQRWNATLLAKAVKQQQLTSHPKQAIILIVACMH